MNKIKKTTILLLVLLIFSTLSSIFKESADTTVVLDGDIILKDINGARSNIPDGIKLKFSYDDGVFANVSLSKSDTTSIDPYQIPKVTDEDGMVTVYLIYTDSVLIYTSVTKIKG